MNGEDHGRRFWIVAVLGWAVIVIGLVGGIRGVSHPDGWAIYLFGAALVHDLVLAPVVFGVGRLISLVTPAWVRPALNGAVAFVAVVALVAAPFALRLGGDPRNRSELPLDYRFGLLLVLVEAAWVALGLLLWRGWRRSRASP